ncbi:hypothetical protein CBR_g12018 [Chara braunii]|uniref:SMP-30/Gluconolactonase/LRE-like region domain-containing protein n=1 Tax=Chara braunii TaxID=69332 RepID=A0A388KQY9_CHABU|nr:hypothetical protein CBR_g12018 [Chara braunii]|eukprot:GBG72442.1 hypothetical protein CBR_g12018 [Chara braunii]
MASTKVELALDCRAVLGESPVCVASGEVYFVDITGKLIYAYNPSNGSHETIGTGGKYVGFVVPRANGGLMAALEDEIISVDVARSGKSPNSQTDTVAGLRLGSVHARIPAANQRAHEGHDFRFNDGKCDPQGRLWAGDMNIKWRTPKPDFPKGSLYVLEKGGDLLTEKVADVLLSNGLAWSSAGDRMFYIDSGTQKVDCFDFVPSTAGISRRRSVISVPKAHGMPDGMAIDAADKLWVAMGDGGTVRQYDPETGTELVRIDLPVRRPTSCAFGGADLSELYVTTRLETGENPSAHHGALFKCHVPGVKGPTFADAYLG